MVRIAREDDRFPVLPRFFSLAATFGTIETASFVPNAPSIKSFCISIMARTFINQASYSSSV